MIKRTLYFANPAYLSSKKQQLVVRYPGNEEERTVPIEDIGLLVLESHQVTISHRLISLLLGNNAAIITCDEQHLPQGMMLNLNASHTQQEHFRVQVEASQALKDRLWKQTIQSKIRNQAALLNQNGVEVENMNRWADKVQNGDPDNFEARAAAYHWKCLFTDLIQNFKRGQFEGEPNNLLNYGYAILRATVARSLLASGLLPTFGYHHRNKYNAYCLADDVMEPYRPYVDELVLELVRSTDDYQTLTPALKQKLLQIPVLDVMINGKQSPLMLAVQQTTASLYQCYAREQKEIKFPKF
ncbi:MAG: type II CRISPR-associated endonuclease Cas1 [Roseivirga sp.]|nr:type II CRISPR-associated endonuclease Cas1 [Roseivirga sp.]